MSSHNQPGQEPGFAFSGGNVTDKAGDIGVATAKAAPPALAYVSGLTVNDLIAWLTVGYLPLQGAYLLWKWRKEAAKR